jgi:hypothetical protein
MIEMVCPHCKLGLKFPDEYAGQKGNCDKCGGEMYVIIPSHLKQENKDTAAYQFNVSMEEMQNPNLGMGNDSMANLLDTDDLDIMSATSGMSARSMGVTSYSHSYEPVDTGSPYKKYILIAIGVVVAVFVVVTALMMINKAGNSGAIEISPPVQIQSDTGTTN